MPRASDTQKFADALREARLEAGLTQQELADHLNVSARTVARWESGDSEPTSRVKASAASLLAGFAAGGPLGLAAAGLAPHFLPSFFVGSAASISHLRHRSSASEQADPTCDVGDSSAKPADVQSQSDSPELSAVREELKALRRELRELRSKLDKDVSS